MATSRREGLAAALKQYATPDFVWWVLGMGEIQDKIVRLAAIMRTHFLAEGAKFDIHGVTADGDRVAIESEVSIPLKDGRVYNNRYHNLYLLREGRIVEIREYHNTAHADPIWQPIFAAEGE